MKNSAGSIGSFNEDDIWRSIAFVPGEIDSYPIDSNLDLLTTAEQVSIFGQMISTYGLQRFLLDGFLDAMIEQLV